MTAHVTPIRVRYTECDPMGVAHHTAYVTWCEIARTEFCRDRGLVYRAFEDDGMFLAVIALEMKYTAPARYDDLVHVETSVTRATRVRLGFGYRITRDGLQLATAAVTLACLDDRGAPRMLPETLQGLG